ncbi:MAG TPA: hypothetical protein ENG48_06800, partial [Candidatus Atribacteria bacterium]|nr:hypothetical protein [Candidatus Atribacteria bacterium]
MKEIFIPKHKLEQLYVYERKSIGEIAQIFNCSKSAIRNKLKKYKIPIRPSNYKRDSFGRFKKGNIPWNKGKKLDKLVGKKRAELIKKKYSDKIT